jgi:hypothetical protein
MVSFYLGIRKGPGKLLMAGLDTMGLIGNTFG